MQLKQIVLMGISLVVIIGCSTTPKSKIETTKEDLNKQDDAEVKITCLASMNTEPNTIIKAVDSGIILTNFDELPKEFSDCVVVETTKEYYINGSTEKSNFEVIYIGINKTHNDVKIIDNSDLGISTGNLVSICVRSKNLDPYIVACSEVVPIKKANHWYYFPGMYVSSQMKWLSYKPVKYDSFKSMYDHATTGEESLGLTMFNWWSLYKTTLFEYPTPNPKNPEISNQLIYFKDMPLQLTYQKGFLKFLQDEYKLGQPIYLYLQITGISGFDKVFNCYVRDFSLNQPEDIVKRRMEHISNTK